MRISLFSFLVIAAFGTSYKINLNGESYYASKKLGTGLYATVFLAENLKGDKIVLKVSENHDMLQKDASALLKVPRDFRTMHCIDDCKIHYNAGKFMFAGTFVNGTNLGVSRYFLSRKERMEILSQIYNFLGEYQNVHHYDLHPYNILIDGNEVKFIDFSGELKTWNKKISTTLPPWASFPKNSLVKNYHVDLNEAISSLDDENITFDHIWSYYQLFFRIPSFLDIAEVRDFPRSTIRNYPEKNALMAILTMRIAFPIIIIVTLVIFWWYNVSFIEFRFSKLWTIGDVALSLLVTLPFVNWMLYMPLEIWPTFRIKINNYAGIPVEVIFIWVLSIMWCIAIWRDYKHFGISVGVAMFCLLFQVSFGNLIIACSMTNGWIPLWVTIFVDVVGTIYSLRLFFDVHQKIIKMNAGASEIESWN